MLILRAALRAVLDALGRFFKVLISRFESWVQRGEWVLVPDSIVYDVHNKCRCATHKEFSSTNSEQGYSSLILVPRLN